VSEFELYRAKWQVTEWRGGAVYRTQYVETAWFDMTEVEHPNTYKTNVLYAPPEAVSTDEERRGIRRKSQ
jgi:hypothetical protein